MNVPVTFRRLLTRGMLPDSDGGLYNPSVWTDLDGTQRLLVRREMDYTWQRPSFPTVVDTVSWQGTTLAFEGFDAKSRIEDCRAFRWREHVLVTHVEYVPGPGQIIYQRLSKKIGDALEKWDPWALPRHVPIRPVEKNWVLGSNGDDLFMVYSLDPLIVCRRVRDGIWKLVHGYPTGLTKAFGKELHNSTHLLPFDGGYLGFWHYILDRSYVTGAYWLDAAFHLRRRSPILVDGAWVQGNVYKAGVCYISSAAIEGDDVKLYYGEGDSHSGVATIAISDIRSVLTSPETRRDRAVRINGLR